MKILPLKQVKHIIPLDSIFMLGKILTPHQINKILLAFRKKRNTTFRINTLKAKQQNVVSNLKKSKFKISTIDILTNAFSLQSKDDSRLLKTTETQNGAIYLQSISSMLVPLVLSPREGENILDIAAAPGSKTSQLAAMMNNTGRIDAIEPDKIRIQRLVRNLNILGVTNTTVIRDYGERIYKNKPNFYDKALADLPCSGEGRFSVHDRASYSNWRLKNIQKFANIQLKILRSAILATRIGGIIVYSTCTLNVIENERVVNRILRDDSLKVKIISIAGKSKNTNKLKNLPESIAPILSFEGESFDASIKNSLRILPSKRMEGFFICKMQRIK